MGRLPGRLPGHLHSRNSRFLESPWRRRRSVYVCLLVFDEKTSGVREVIHCACRNHRRTCLGWLRWWVEEGEPGEVRLQCPHFGRGLVEGGVERLSEASEPACGALYKLWFSDAEDAAARLRW